MGGARKLLARNLRVLRLVRGWSQERLAEEAGLDRSYVSDIERATRNVSVEILERLACAFGVSLSELLSEPNPVELGEGLLNAYSGDITENKE